MAKVSVHVDGLNGLRIALRELPERVQARVLQNAVAKGALLIRNAARAIVRVDTGLLRRSIRSTRGVRRSTEASAFVSVRRLSKSAVARFKKANPGKSSQDNPNDPFYWSILEFGKSDRTAHPFLRPAFNSTKEAAARAIAEALGKGIQVEAAKLYTETRGKK